MVDTLADVTGNEGDRMTWNGFRCYPLFLHDGSVRDKLSSFLFLFAKQDVWLHELDSSIDVDESPYLVLVQVQLANHFDLLSNSMNIHSLEKASFNCEPSHLQP
jgi:hypothetical protein